MFSNKSILRTKSVAYICLCQKQGEQISQKDFQLEPQRLAFRTQLKLLTFYKAQLPVRLWCAITEPAFLWGYCTYPVKPQCLALRYQPSYGLDLWIISSFWYLLILRVVIITSQTLWTFIILKKQGRILYLQKEGSYLPGSRVIEQSESPAGGHWLWSPFALHHKTPRLNHFRRSPHPSSTFSPTSKHTCLFKGGGRGDWDGEHV